MITFQRVGSQVLEEDIPGLQKTTPKRSRGLYNCNFPQVYVLRKRRLRIYSQEENYLKFNQAEGRVKVILVAVKVQRNKLHWLKILLPHRILDF